ncbi:MAG: hypothetical protein U0Z53_16985 [Blastocatellia bacterium]
MFFFTFTARPKPGTRRAKQFGGAHVDCWINFAQYDGAKHLAKYFIEKNGWVVVRKTNERWVEQKHYKNDPEGLSSYLEAEKNGASFTLEAWPLKAKR